ncbi:peptidase domain-containing ABC transporter [Bacillus swezeyi]|uniref:peptidase domain-containing ABC transporter n=1 Tax=Bacillus swezeyi TaxID=1925020 RepID=UPI002E227E68|nr:peptidase domain-containing ABC transporter [Bacillus swezeyi]
MKKVPLIRQMGQNECGPACLSMILHFYGCKVSLNEISEACNAQSRGVSIKTLTGVSSRYGLTCRAFQVCAKDLYAHISSIVPCILFWDERHFVVLESLKKDHLEIIDPMTGRKKIIKEDFAKHYSQVILTFEKTDAFQQRSSYSDLKYYMKYAVQSWKIVLSILIFTLLTQVFIFFIPFLMKEMIDAAVLENSLSHFLKIEVGMLFLLFIIGLFFLRSYWVIKLQASFSQQMTNDFINHVLKLPLSFYEHRTAGDIASRINNIAVIREIIVRNGSGAILDALMLLTIFTAMSTQSMRLALFSIGLALLQLLLMAFIMPKLNDLKRKNLSAQTASQSFMAEALRAMPFIKSNGLDPYIVKRSLHYDKKQTESFKRHAFTDAVLESISSSLQFCAPLILIGFGLKETVNGSLTIGGLIGFSALGACFFLPVASLIRHMQQFQFIGDILERIRDVFKTEPERSTHKPLDFNIAEQDIRLENVSFSYGNTPVIKNLSLTVKAGTKAALVGTSGSGKTTLSRLILGLYRPDAGKVYYGDQDLTGINLYELRGKMGAVLQESYLFNDTIANNISGFKDLSFDAIINAAKHVDLHEDIEQMPMGYNTIIGENGSFLSGGQKQRLAIARAIVNNPSVVILDEITSHLDTLTESKIDSYFDQSKTTRIIISHRLSGIKNADQIVVLDSGEIIEQGSHHELIENKGRYYELWKKEEEKKRKMIAYSL